MPNHDTGGEQNTNTHTHTQYTLLLLSLPNDQNKLLMLHGPALNQLLKTVALQSHKQTLTARSSHRQSAFILCGTLLDSGNALEDMKFSFSTSLLRTMRKMFHIIQWIVRNKWIMRNTVNTQLTLRNTVHRIADGYCSIFSTEYSKTLLDTVRRMFNGYCSILSTDHSLILRLQIKNKCTRRTQYIAHTFNTISGRPITPCNNIPSPAVQ